MSDLILPAGLEADMPNLRSDREKAQWWEGKATRREMATQVNNTSQRIDKEMYAVSRMMSNVYSMARVNGLQLETMVRLMEKAVPGYKENFDIEFKKTLAFVGFLDTINPPGEHSQKPMKERIQMVRDWNAIEDGVKATGDQFGLEEYITKNQTEFTLEERIELAKEFDMSLPEIPPVVEVQEPVPHVNAQADSNTSSTSARA